MYLTFVDLIFFFVFGYISARLVDEYRVNHPKKRKPISKLRHI